MYLEHFGLERPPFKITPDPRLFYSGGKRGSVLDALVYAITSGEGITKVVGEVGSGKTMLCRMLETRLPEHVDIVYIANPSLSAENILQVIAFELKLGRQESSKLEAMQALQQWLLGQHAAGRHVVVFIEEAQSMPLATLEEIRLLSNLETDQSKLLQIVLFGQPELDVKLDQPAIRQLRERIGHGFYLAPLAPAEIREYLNFRMRSAGYHGPDIFDRATASLVHRYSRGLIRRINIIADKSLLAAFAQGTATVAPTHVRTAARDSRFARAWHWRPGHALAAGVTVGMLAGGGGLLAWQSQAPTVAPTQAPAEALAATVTGSPAPPAPDVTEPDTGRRLAAAVAPAPASATVPAVNARASGVAANPDGVAAPAAARAGTGPGGLQTWLDAAEVWLREAPAQHFSIQLLTVAYRDAQRLVQDLQRLAASIELDKVYIYETRINEQPMLAVLYNDYATRDEALAAIAALPFELRQNRPYLRTVGRLRGEIQG